MVGVGSAGIDLSAAGKVSIGQLTTTGQLTVTSTGGRISDVSDTGVDITALTATLNGDVSPGDSLGILSVDGNFAFANNDKAYVSLSSGAISATAND